MKNVPRDLFFPLMVSSLLLVQACSLPDRPASPAVKAGEEITPAQTATILLFSENLRFVRMNGFTGGSEIHRDQINELARLLQKEGVDVEVREMDGGEASMRDLARSRMIYIVDTFCIYPEFRALLEEYVRGGGVVVGIGEVGRFAGTWTKEWLYADLFGLDMKPVDPWETCVSWADRNFYRYSRVMAGNEPLLQGIGGPHGLLREAPVLAHPVEEGGAPGIAGQQAVEVGAAGAVPRPAQLRAPLRQRPSALAFAPRAPVVDLIAGQGVSRLGPVR